MKNKCHELALNHNGHDIRKCMTHAHQNQHIPEYPGAESTLNRLTERLQTLAASYTSNNSLSNITVITNEMPRISRKRNCILLQGLLYSVEHLVMLSIFSSNFLISVITIKNRRPMVTAIKYAKMQIANPSDVCIL